MEGSLMSEKVQMNLNVLPETKERIRKMGLATFRSPGDALDWIIENAWRDFAATPESAVSVETVGDLPLPLPTPLSPAGVAGPREAEAAGKGVE